MPPSGETGMRPLDPRLLDHARAARTYLVLCVVLGLAVAALLVAQATLLADPITAAFLGGAGLAALRTTLLLLGAVVVGRAALDWAQEIGAHRAGAAVISQLRGKLLEHAVRLGPGWLSTERSGELGALATRGLDALDGYFSRYLPQLVLAVLVPVAVLLRVFGVDLAAGLTIAVTLPLVPVFMILVGLASRHRADRQWRALSVLAGHFLDVVAGLPTLKVFAPLGPTTATRRPGVSSGKNTLVAVLLLDEPTEHLDLATADALAAELVAATAGRTTLLVTHRLATLEEVDEIVVLDAGRVVQRGTHARLLATGGPYRRMWDLERDARRFCGDQAPLRDGGR